MDISLLKENYHKIYMKQPNFYISCGGRFEILGNHTDHNHGLCIVANASCRIEAVFSKENASVVMVKSIGYPKFEFSLDNLKYKDSDYKSEALIKGILFKLKEDGYKIGGFSIFINSDIPSGGGVSSSAALESLIGYVVSYLFNENKISPLEIAKVGKFSENEYFKKPSGLLDQIGTSFDDANFIDFKNIDEPLISNLSFDLPLSLYLINSEGNHSNLTNLYAEIPQSMKKVAKLLDNKEFLRDCNEKDVLTRIDKLNCTQKEKNIAKHFFIENENVLKGKEAILNNDVETFLNCVNVSQNSSFKNLENTYVKGEYDGSPQYIIDTINKYLENKKGAIRIHGGGFKGTVIAFIKNEYVEEFESYLEKTTFKDRFVKVSISKKAEIVKEI